MDSLADREWRLIGEEPATGDEHGARRGRRATAVADGVRTVRVYQWAPSCLSLGYRQAAESVDWAYCEREAST